MSRTKGEMFAGVTVAIITPLRNDEVDYAALRKLVDFHVAEGTDCLAPVGTTGESPTLSHDEHEKVIAAVVEQAAGRIKVMPGTGSNSTREAIRLTKFAKSAGADGSLQVGPYYNKPTQEGYFRHFAAIAEACDLPIVLYNIPAAPGRTSRPRPSPASPRSRPSWPSRRRPARWTRRRTSPHCATSPSSRETTA